MAGERLPIVVLTGGPSGGKTDAMKPEWLKKSLVLHGILPIMVAETPTEFFAAGFKPNENISLWDFQKQMFLFQLAKEERFLEAAALVEHPRPVVILDRGLMDPEAYLGPAKFRDLITSLGFTIPTIRDLRYDAVIHLLSPGVDAPSVYTLTTNEHRFEKTPAEAAVADIKTQKAWVGHSHLRVIDNSTDFAGKMDRLTKAICHAVGVPMSLEIERKFLLDPSGLPLLPDRPDVLVADVDIEQAYLSRTDEFGRRIRKRGQDGSYVHYLTRKRFVESGVHEELETRIEAAAYDEFLRNERDSGYDIIKKIRFCFLWKNQYFELDVFIEPWRLFGTALLEIELLDKDEPVELPPFLNIVREVTDDPAYSNRALARRSA